MRLLVPCGCGRAVVRTRCSLPMCVRTGLDACSGTDPLTFRRAPRPAARAAAYQRPVPATLKPCICRAAGASGREAVAHGFRVRVEGPRRHVDTRPVPWADLGRVNQHDLVDCAPHLGPGRCGIDWAGLKSAHILGRQRGTATWGASARDGRRAAGTRAPDLRNAW